MMVMMIASTPSEKALIRSADTIPSLGASEAAGYPPLAAAKTIAFGRVKTRRPAKTSATFGGAAKKWLVLLYFQ
jgi:hypothetical protein